jgi:hypothetical protein
MAPKKRSRAAAAAEQAPSAKSRKKDARQRVVEEVVAEESAEEVSEVDARAAEARAVLGGELHTVLRPLLKSTFPTLSDAKHNKHAVLGLELSHQFLAHGITSISDLTLVVHGSPKANHKSIEREGLLLSKAVSTPGVHWCTTDVELARQYSRGTTDHLYVFAAHRRLLTEHPWGGRCTGRVFTFNTPHALTPLFRTTMPSPALP